MVQQKKIDIETMFRTIMGLIMAAMGISQASVFMTDSKKGQTAQSNVFSILDRQPLIDARDTTGETREDFHGEINFKNVNFRYPQRPDLPIYQDITFQINPGETVSFVGQSGCGKSTIIQLLQRFYDIEMLDETKEEAADAHVQIMGTDVKEYNIGFLRSQMGLVSQEPHLFDCSIAENLRYGKADATMEEIVAAAKIANAHDFILGFPDGYDTAVGKLGGQISGGQKQRIAIARAMLRNPKILLLDEATSALDAESEKVVQAALDELMKDKSRTTIVIAHRLSTIKNADKIVVLSNEDNKGSIVEEIGTHDELVRKQGGCYQRLVKIAEISNAKAEAGG